MDLINRLRAWASELTAYFVFLLLTATIGPFLFGYHLAELNAPQDVITCAKKSITSIPAATAAVAASGLNLPQCIPMNPAQIGLVTSIFTLGGLMGALLAGPASAKIGRLRPMRITTAFFVAGAVVEALATGIVILSLGRFVSGVGAGAAIVIVPIYISEIAPPKERGFFGSFTQVMTNSGILVAQVLGYFLSHDSMWRYILAFAGLMGLLQLLGLAFSIDSPKWKADHGHAKTAQSDLRKIRGAGADIQEEIASWHISEADVGEGVEEEERANLLSATSTENENFSGVATPKQHALHREQPRSISIVQCLTTQPYARATYTIILVMVAQQFTGINSIVMYGVNLLSELLQANSALLNILVSVLNVLVTTASAPLIDIWGRKTCLMASVSVMGVSSLLLGVGIRSSIKLLSAISVLLFVSGFGLGLGPVPFILASELVGVEAVGAAQSCGLAANWISTFVVAQFFPIINSALGKGVVYFVFAALAVLFVVLIGWLVPETKDKKDADEVWGRSLRVRRED